MLDFSHGQGSRIRDHRDVGGAHKHALGGTEGMRIFQQVTGAIRLGATPIQRPRGGAAIPPIVWLDAEVPPTDAQLRQIASVISFVEPGHVELIAQYGKRKELSWPSGSQVARAAQDWFDGE